MQRYAVELDAFVARWRAARDAAAVPAPYSVDDCEERIVSVLDSVRESSQPTSTNGIAKSSCPDGPPP